MEEHLNLIIVRVNEIVSTPQAEYKNDADDQKMSDQASPQYHHASHLTKSLLQHEEPAPIAERFTDKRSRDDQMPSEAT